MFGSIITIGAMIGAVTSGRLADYIGRKGAMRMSAVFCITGWLAVYFAVEALFLDVGRFCTGYGIGIFSYVVPVFIAEIAPKNLRGGLATLNQLMIVCGASTAYIVGSVVTWRTLALTGLIPCLLLLVGLFFIPESPRWLAKVGRKKEFESALRRLRGRNADIMQEANEIQASIDVLLDQPRVRILDLFDPKYIRPVTVGVGLMVFQQFGGINGIGFYSSETFVAAGFSSGKAGTIAYAIIQVPITMLGAVLMDKSGRRPLLIISAAGTCLGCIMTGASFFLKDQSLLPQCVPFLAVSGVLVYISAFSIGTGPVPWVVMSEIFPIHIKGVAGSLVVLVNWLGAWLVSYTFNYMMSWSSAGTFSIYAAFCALTILFVAKIMPETKGKTLEEIQASLRS
ncbi:sugar transporter ERD6-like 16 isoform X2 [Salvia miltiorrhiza]|nr:sugar transporter ERD6-like 16 isoform X2 [Salvia miltiorrhiza]